MRLREYNYKPIAEDLVEGEVYYRWMYIVSWRRIGGYIDLCEVEC
jgi:hypothetical protein